MGAVPVAVKPAREVGDRPTRRWHRAELLVPVGYLLIGILLTWRVWANPASMAPTNGGGKVSPDIYLAAWFMRYSAAAIWHGHLPALFTTALNYPRGISVMWNTSILLPAIVLSPVTVYWGPMVSLAVLTTLGFAGSGGALYLVLRRWGVSIPASVLGGAFYAFSPALMTATLDHYHLQFAVLPPLIIDALLRVAVGRVRPGRFGLVWTSVWLGVLIAAQVFIAEEMLVDTAICAAIILLFLVLNRPEVLARIGELILSGAIAGVIVLLLCGWALRAQFTGQLVEHGSPWQISRSGNPPGNFVKAPIGVVFHGNIWPYLQHTGQYLVEYYAYLSWPLIALLVLITVLFWRDIRVRVAALSCLMLEWISMGGHALRVGHFTIPATVLAWHYLWHIPVISQILVTRLSILADGLAAVVLAVGFDRARKSLPIASALRTPVVAAVIAAALIPVIPQPVPASAIIATPRGWRHIIQALHLYPQAPVLVVPLQGALAMGWQATTGENISVVGGYCLVASEATGHATQCDQNGSLNPAQETLRLRMKHLVYGVPRVKRSTHMASHTTTLAAIRGWRPAAVICIFDANTKIGKYFLGFFGPPTVRSGHLLAWRLKPGWYEHLPWLQRARAAARQQ